MARSEAPAEFDASGLDRGAWYRSIDDGVFDALIAEMDPCQRHMLLYHWELTARAEQMEPEGDWRLWLILAGRGYGKSRSGAEWVRRVAADPQARIALVGASLPEVRSVMVEGDSGVLAVCPPQWPQPEYEPSLRRITFPSGAQAFLYSAAEPDSLRGPQHSHAWCDEIAKWDNAGERATQAWDNLQMGLRVGSAPRILATTTPRAVPLVRRLLAAAEKPDGVLIRGRTLDNSRNLPGNYLKSMEEQYGGTTIGRQELDGELLTEAEGALWTRALLDRQRLLQAHEELVRVVVAVDPPASARGDACGIVAAGVTGAGKGLVLADASVTGASPDTWARIVAVTAQAWSADRVVAEANNGGDMIGQMLRNADCHMPITLVHARRGKVARAEPVAALYEAGRVHHVGNFGLLEDQLCGLLAGGAYEGPGRSPDRADALVWALTHLMLTTGPEPRVRQM